MINGVRNSEFIFFSLISNLSLTLFFPEPFQHAPEADNVADSEESEDEWKYYCVDPNKESATKRCDEEKRNVVKDGSAAEVESPRAVDDTICKEEQDTSSKFISLDVSTFEMYFIFRLKRILRLKD